MSTRCTEAFSSHRPKLSIWGFSLWSEPNNPRVVIQPGIVPGQCWSFRGFDGYLVIQLSRRIIPSSFTLEHIPRSLAPDGQIDSAPRNFTVYVRLNLRLDKKPVHVWKGHLIGSFILFVGLVERNGFGWNSTWPVQLQQFWRTFADFSSPGTIRRAIL